MRRRNGKRGRKEKIGKWREKGKVPRSDTLIMKQYGSQELKREENYWFQTSVGLHCCSQAIKPH